MTRVLTFPRLLPQQAITKKRTEKTEVRAAARDAALREIKERQRKAKASSKIASQMRLGRVASRPRRGPVHCGF